MFIPDAKKKDQMLKEVGEKLLSEGNHPCYFDYARETLDFISDKKVKDQLKEEIDNYEKAVEYIKDGMFYDAEYKVNKIPNEELKALLLEEFEKYKEVIEHINRGKNAFCQELDIAKDITNTTSTKRFRGMAIEKILEYNEWCKESPHRIKLEDLE